MNAKRYFAIL